MSIALAPAFRAFQTKVQVGVRFHAIEPLYLMGDGKRALKRGDGANAFFDSIDRYRGNDLRR